MKLLNNGLTQAVSIQEIIVPEGRLRRVSEAKVVAIASMIKIFGFIGAIEVRRERGKLVLVDGEHRLDAAKRQGLTEVPVVMFEGTKADARAREIAANLAGGMTPLQDAMFLSEWKSAYEDLYPQTKQGVAGGLARQGKQLQNLSFAELVAEQRECDVRTVERRVAAVKRLTPDEIKDVEQLCPGSAISAIEALGKISDPQMRADVLEELRRGDANKVSVAIKSVKAAHGQAPKPDGEGDKFLHAISNAWKRAPMAARRRFVEDHRDILEEMLGRGPKGMDQ